MTFLELQLWCCFFSSRCLFVLFQNKTSLFYNSLFPASTLLSYVQSATGHLPEQQVQMNFGMSQFLCLWYFWRQKKPSKYHEILAIVVVPPDNNKPQLTTSQFGEMLLSVDHGSCFCLHP